MVMTCLSKLVACIISTPVRHRLSLIKLILHPVIMCDSKYYLKEITSFYSLAYIISIKHSCFEYNRVYTFSLTWKNLPEKYWNMFY